MKKLLVLIVGGLLSVSCYEKGEVINQPTDFIKIHNKIYKLTEVVPCDGCNPIWIMYPKDSTDTQPEVINYDNSEGKHHVNQTVIKID